MYSFRHYLEILMVATRLGLTSFGGPVAHLAYFQEEYIKRKKWLDDKTYADLIALCQFLPGPASSQVGISIGMIRGGVLGGILAWIGFTLPSVIVLILFAMFMIQADLVDSTFIGALKVVAVAVVAHAIINMGKKLTPDLPRIAFAIVAAGILLLAPLASTQIIIILVAALVGYFMFRKQDLSTDTSLNIDLSKKVGAVSLTLFFALLLVLPLISRSFDHVYVQLFDIFYRVGSLVFGGGHVVLPLLERELVPNGFLSEEMFLAGYGAAQAIPGPLFTFSSYLGQVASNLGGAVVATLGIFLPSFLLLIGILPFWKTISQYKAVRAALIGVNAAVVGILLAAFYDPIFTSGISSSADFAVALVGFSLLQFWKKPAWLVVIITVLLYMLVAMLI
ncbi:chromate efflux transporter [Aquisalibacillus elongatus]|uniref:Chromate transporter n=1 Tax=Aquisalibacillus elongatus TaxID=485577 RepID=A0A3N5C1U0_9BACI|nr:chromate efflux transporter [Aquisalibacillus elongatus]RPF50141.1 chromate transporter [Aquisalibacillus elongatus]